MRAWRIKPLVFSPFPLSVFSNFFHTFLLPGCLFVPEIELIVLGCSVGLLPSKFNSSIIQVTRLGCPGIMVLVLVEGSNHAFLLHSLDR